MEERVPVLAVRTAMDFEHERVQLAGVEAIGLQKPALDHPSIGSCELMPFRLGDVAVAQPWVEVCEASLSALGRHVELARAARIRGSKRQDPGSEVEIEDSALAAGLLPDVALEVSGVGGGHA